jgi:hypothetical protein
MLRPLVEAFQEHVGSGQDDWPLVIFSGKGANLTQAVKVADSDELDFVLLWQVAAEEVRTMLMGLFDSRQNLGLK